MIAIYQAALLKQKLDHDRHIWICFQTAGLQAQLLCLSIASSLQTLHKQAAAYGTRETNLLDQSLTQIEI